MEQQNNNNQKPQDPMVKFKSTTIGQNSKGGDRLQLSLDAAEVEYLIEQLQAVKTERGVKFDIHTSEKEALNGPNAGRKFFSSIAFIKGIQEFGAPRGAVASGSGSTAAVQTQGATAPAGGAVRNAVAGLKTQTVKR